MDSVCHFAHFKDTPVKEPVYLISQVLMLSGSKPPFCLMWCDLPCANQDLLSSILLQRLFKFVPVDLLSLLYLHP